MRKYLILFLICVAVMSHAQQTPVFYDHATDALLTSTNSGANTNLILSAGATNLFNPAFGCLHLESSPQQVAESISATNATNIVGVVTNTHFIDQVYYVAEEDGNFEVTLTYSNAATTAPQEFGLIGYYDGNPSRSVQASVYNYTGATFDDISGAVMNNASSPQKYSWLVPSPMTNYISTNGLTQLKLTLVAVSPAGDTLYIDYAELLYRGAVLPNAGIWYDVGAGADVEASVNCTATTNGTIVTTDAGWYKIGWTVSFTGSSNTTFVIRHSTNGVANDIEMWRTIGATPQIGNASAFGYCYLEANTTNGWQIRADTENAYFTPINGHAEMIKIGN